MKTPTSADALRAARALLGVSIRDLEPRVGLMRKAIAASESGNSTILEHNLKLIEFYEAEGIEFLGDLSFGKKVGRPGARWRAPDDRSLSSLAASGLNYHTERFRNSFAAARALLGDKQSVIAKATRLPATTVSSLELGQLWQNPSETLLQYYIERGVEFLGWQDAVRPNVYFGVGVRWAADKAQD
ncbi:XRE family transcriptional regulator [Rhizobium acidisoli]|uniref:XRE family transcriptional regulator n=1 Tax=Rhizobium acidisoli TaxID=1538158 RepID=A0AAE5WPQ1_9HYPH|nr:hypothetical protein [Rhizobium acidisoli]KPH05024.1 hypothetical protein AOG23_29995 [Rhizobium acidisoli]QAS78602.1 XRE family transcriptional regulator [Rhizobium acidisoli]